MAAGGWARRGRRLPGRLALLLGIGALSTAGAQAETLGDREPTSRGDVLVRSEGQTIYLREQGRETELRLSPTPERDRLLRLLEEHGSAGVKLDPDPRLIMSGGGGTGFSWWEPKKSATDKPAPARQNPPQVTTPPKLPEQG